LGATPISFDGLRTQWDRLEKGVAEFEASGGRLEIEKPVMSEEMNDAERIALRRQQEKLETLVVT
jgi:hypothetical protein